MSGAPDTEELGQEFSAELHKINKDIELRTSQLILKIREKLYSKLQTWIDAVEAKEIVGSRTKHKELVDAMNAVNKAYPQINIESHVWNVTMSKEELLNEFKRLATVSRESFIRGRVPGSVEGGREQVSVLLGSGDKASKAAEDTTLRAEPPAIEVPQVEGADKGDLRGE